jgi:hypothetical protein
MSVDENVAMRRSSSARSSTLPGRIPGRQGIAGTEQPWHGGRHRRGRLSPSSASAQLAARCAARPGTALTLPGAAAQIVRIEIRLHPAATQNAIEYVPVTS